MRQLGRGVPWVCGNCRAINQQRWSRCYACRAPRALAVDPGSAAAPIPVTDRTPPERLAEIARGAGAKYRRSRLWATIAESAIVAVTALQIVRLVAFVQAPEILEKPVVRATSDITIDVFGALYGIQLVAWVLGFIAWGLWLRRVIGNVPALGGGWTRSSPGDALLSSIIPIYNVYYSAGVLREALERLSPKGKARTGLLAAWWLTLLIAVLPQVPALPGPAIVVRVAYEVIGGLLVAALSEVTGSLWNAATVIVTLSTGLLVLAAGLALTLIEHVQRLQSVRAEELGLESMARSTTAIVGADLVSPQHAAMIPAGGWNPVAARTPDPAEDLSAPPGLLPLAEPPRRDDHPLAPELPELGPHAAEVEPFIESLGMMNRDEAGRVHRQGLASGAGGGSRWASLDRQLDAAATASGLEPARLEAQRRATRASARSDARFGNRYVIADECAGVWAAVLVLRDHLDRATAAMAFEPWEDVLVRPEWL
jgi:hypothetical protein